MFRVSSLLVLLFLALASFAAAPAIVTLDGKTVSVPVLTSGGRAYVDVAALMKLLGGTAAFDAKANKVSIKTTVPAPAGKATGSGTAQLPGDNGKIGQIYNMKKDSPLYFSLQSAEYTTEQVVIGDEIYFPTADEKLLVLHFTIQNPQQTETFIRGDYLYFTAVDAMNVNHEGIQIWGDAESQKVVEMMLKPAQKIAAYTVIKVPAKGVVPKLIVLPGENNGGVLRFDLRGAVTGLKAPFADPSDTASATALETVLAQMGVTYPFQNFDITVEKTELTTEALDEEAPEEDGQFLVATLLIHNDSPSPAFLRSDYISPVLTSTDGEELTYNNMLFALANRPIAQELKPQQEMRVRIYFTVPEGSMAQTLTMKEGESHSYQYELAK